MVRELEIGAGCRCRMWSDETPKIVFSQETSESRVVSAVDTNAGMPFLAAAEVLIPRGARVVYGALVVEYFPSVKQDWLEIEVAIKDRNDVQWSDSIAASLDEVYVGLPTEYVGAIFSGACLALAQSNCQLSGRLRFSGGAHGCASSNDNIFKGLAFWVVSKRGDIDRMSDVSGLRSTMF